MAKPIVLTFHVTGTLSANITPMFVAPFDMQLIEAQSNASNASTANWKIGKSDSDAAYLALCDVGDSGVPAEKGRTNFVDAQFPHIAKGTIVLITFDYNGAGATAAQNATMVLTFTKG